MKIAMSWKYIRNELCRVIFSGSVCQGNTTINCARRVLAAFGSGFDNPHKIPCVVQVGQASASDAGQPGPDVCEVGEEV